jgi:hypothetical protein
MTGTVTNRSEAGHSIYFQNRTTHVYDYNDGTESRQRPSNRTHNTSGPRGVESTFVVLGPKYYIYSVYLYYYVFEKILFFTLLKCTSMLVNNRQGGNILVC